MGPEYPLPIALGLCDPPFGPCNLRGWWTAASRHDAFFHAALPSCPLAFALPGDEPSPVLIDSSVVSLRHFFLFPKRNSERGNCAFRIKIVATPGAMAPPQLGQSIKQKSDNQGNSVCASPPIIKKTDAAEPSERASRLPLKNPTCSCGRIGGRKPRSVITC